MSPTILREAGYRLFFFSREESRMHVHVQHADGEVKFWLEPQIEEARRFGLSARQVARALQIVQEHEHEVRAAWADHFGR